MISTWWKFLDLPAGDSKICSKNFPCVLIIYLFTLASWLVCYILGDLICHFSPGKGEKFSGQVLKEGYKLKFIIILLWFNGANRATLFNRTWTFHLNTPQEIKNGNLLRRYSKLGLRMHDEPIEEHLYWGLTKWILRCGWQASPYVSV